VGQVAARRDGAELAVDKARQRALVVVASGDEFVEVVPQEARERAGFRVSRSIGTRSTRATVRGSGMVEVGRLKDAHPPPMSTRHAITMARSLSRFRAPPMCLVAVSAVSDGTPVGHISSMLPSRGDGGGPPGLAEADCKGERPRTRSQVSRCGRPPAEGRRRHHRFAGCPTDPDNTRIEGHAFIR